MPRKIQAGVALMLALAGAAPAQLVPGPEFRVNGRTAASQGMPAIAGAADGDFVVVWSEGALHDPAERIFARRFRADGSAAGADVRVDSVLRPRHASPAVAVAPDGEFVVAWEVLVPRGMNSDHDVVLRRFDALGSPLGAEVVAHGFVPSDQRRPVVAIDAAGEFVVAWEGQDGNGRGIFARWFAADGTPLAPEIQVNVTAAGNQVNPSVSADPLGNVVVAWSQDGAAPGTRMQRFDSSARRVGGEIEVGPRGQYPDVAHDAFGGFAVIWQAPTPVTDPDTPEDTQTLYVRRFQPSGVAAGSAIAVADTGQTGAGSMAEIAVDQGGSFTVVWATSPVDTSPSDVRARSFDASGNPLGASVLVTGGEPQQIRPDAFASDGGFVAVWESEPRDPGDPGTDGDGSGVFGRRFEPAASLAAAIDFGGNGDTDVAVFRPAQGRWIVDFDFQPSIELSFVYGRSGDIPVPMDYDGDGTTDFAVFRPSTRNWFVDTNHNGGTDFQVTYGQSTDVPAPADYDGNGSADLAVWRPSYGGWFVDLDRNGGTDIQAVFGESGSILVPGDYDGDGRDDLAVFHQGAWRIDTDRNGVSNLTVVYGRAGDVPMPGDYDGDGRTDFALWRPASGTWFVDTNRNGGTDLQVVYGRSGDVPVAGDFNGDGRTSFAVYRRSSGTWFIDSNRNGGTDFSLVFGQSGDVPLRENGWILDRLGVVP